MGTTVVHINFSITKEQFISMLLLNKTVDTTTDTGKKISLLGCANHKKNGKPGIEDGCKHTFETWVEYEGKDYPSFYVTVKSPDGGENYSGSLSLTLHTPFNPFD